jgi:hypothetical protein
MSKLKVPVSVAPLYNRCKTSEEKSKLLRHYKEWQEGMFAKAHYDYLVKEYEKLIQDYVESSWINRFMQRNFIIENKAKLAILKKLQSTFKCEEIQ